jgi:ABC-type sulfate transport system substrate-binding protein
MSGHHPQSQDLRRGPLELSRRLGLGRDRFGGDEAAGADFVDALPNVPVLDPAARGATTTFAQRGIGDVLLAWENEAYLALEELGADKFEIVVPSMSILAEPPVAVVDGNVDRKRHRELAEAYLEYLYSPDSARRWRQALLPPARARAGRRTRGSSASPK